MNLTEENLKTKQNKKKVSFKLSQNKKEIKLQMIIIIL